MSFVAEKVASIRAAARERWVRTVAVLWVAQVVSEIGFGFALPFTPLYLQELGVTDVGEAALWAGFTAASFAVAMGAMAPVWGALADRFSHRLMIQRAFFGAGVALGAIAFVQTPEQMLALRIMHGILTGVVTAIATFASLATPSDHLGTVLGLMQSALFLGIALGPALGGAFADQFGLRAAFAATGVILVGTGIVVSLVVREPPRPSADEQAQAPADNASGNRRRSVGRDVVVIVLLMVVVRLALVAPNPILPLFVQRLMAGGDHLNTAVGTIFAVTGIASTLSAVVVGRLADRFGRRGPLLGCLILAALLSPLQALVSSVWQLIVLRTAIGLAVGGIGTAVQALLADATPANRRGTAFGLLTTANSVGNGAGPISGSVVAAGFGVPAVFLALGPIYGLAALVVARTRRPRKDPEAAAEPARSG